MLSSFKRALAIAAGLLLAGTSQAASVYLTPSNLNQTGIGILPATLEVMLDLTGVTSIGGGVEFDFTGVVSFTAFTPSAFFDSKDTTDDDTDFTGFGNPASDADLEIHIGDFAGITGVNSLGTIFVNIAAGLPGTITVAPSSVLGGFVDFTTNQPIVGFAYGNNGLGAQVVPLPATAWLLATGFGLAGFWRRRRS